MKKVKCLVIGALIVSLSVSEVNSQTYFKADITSGNLWIDAAAIGASYLINKSKKQFVVDNYLTLNAFPTDVDNNHKITSTSDNIINPIGSFKFPEFLNGLGTGMKIGYKKEYEYFISHLVLYGSLHFTYNYFTLDMAGNGIPFKSYENSTIRVSPGIGGNITLGRQGFSVILDLNLRYDLPVFYKGTFGEGAGCLNSGFSPRMSASVGGPVFKNLGMNIGVFYEFMTYNWFKPSEYFVEPYTSKCNTFGINFTMYPWE